MGVTLTEKRTRNELQAMVEAHEARIASLETRIAELEQPKSDTPEEAGTDWGDPALARGYEMLQTLLATRRRFGSLG
jgi:hypothetical protein